MRVSYSLPALVALAVTGLCVVGQPVPAAAQDGFGKVTGRFVFEGDIPEPRKIIAKGDAQVRDAQVCAAKDLYANDLVVDEKSRGIANIFVYVRSVRQVHPQLRQPAQKQVVFDQQNCEFIPHALFARTDQEVVVKSNDPVPHNTRTNALRNQSVNFTVRPNDRVGVPVSHKVSEILPIEVKCDFHPHMKAYWLILEHPYAAVTNEKGEFTIDMLPAGEHELRVWQELSGYVPLPANPRRGVLKVNIEANGVTDVGEIKLTAATFEE